MGATITIRMYRQLLGDCFLLTHRKDDGGVEQVYRALIDCGVLQCIGKEVDKPQTKAGTRTIHSVVDNLITDTGGVLDLVIATHEHYDHLSGFLLGFQTFKAKPLVIKALWLAWTEKPGDGEAEAIRANGRSSLKALAALADAFATGDDAAQTIRERNAPKWLEDYAKQVSSPTGDAERRAQNIDALLQFQGEIDKWVSEITPPSRDPEPVWDVDKPPRSCADVLRWLRATAKEPNVRYLEPGEIVSFGVDKTLRAHVLGPPRRPDRLLKLNPSEGKNVVREVYLTTPDDAAALDATLRFLETLPTDGAISAEDAGKRAEERAKQAAEYPFAARFDRTAKSAPGCAVVTAYRNPQEAARGIDDEWMGTAEALALKVDSDVNNTSLVLAIEVSKGGDVLLLPADAQVGNWLSWHDQTYPPKPAKPGDPTVSATDLLNRTVLYKVGHHGSHNATAKALGLELMTSPHLAAMIPVVEAVAREQKSSTNPLGWAMPYGDLNARLKERTGGRIVRGDGDVKAEALAFANSRFTYASPEPLYVELTLEIPPGSPK